MGSRVYGLPRNIMTHEENKRHKLGDIEVCPTLPTLGNPKPEFGIRFQKLLSVLVYREGEM